MKKKAQESGIAGALKPPYCAVIFASQRTDADGGGYEAMAERMRELASEQEGFLGMESARDGAGFGLTVSYWRDHASARKWKQNAEHLEAQRMGREKWYREYRTRICTVSREYGRDD